MRNTITSVTNFIYCGDDYLFVKRKPNAYVNPGVVNGIGGKLEPGEDYVSAAIRETQEEAGFVVSENDIHFCGLIKFEAGYPDIWITSFFKIEVPTKQLAINPITREGELFWMSKDQVAHTDLILIDDLNYVMDDIFSGDKQFFMNITVDDKGEKVIHHTTHKLKIKE